MFHLLLCKCFAKLLKQDDKGDVSTETTGPAQAGLLSAETCTPSRLCVLGLWIGYADCLGPWFDALLVQWCLEKYADHIALPVVFSLPAEVGASAVDCSGFAAGRPALLSSSLSVVMAWYLLCILAGCCSGCSGLEEQSLRTIRLAGVFPLRLRVFSFAARGSAGAGASSLALELPRISASSSWLWCSMGVCQSKMSSADRFSCSVLPAPSDGSTGRVGWAVAVAGAGCSAVGGVEKKAAADGNQKRRKLIKDVRNTFVSSICWS
ncbi:hypothetical protein V6N11_058659 [Hibiscus sabdariffa]|uniref:Uncharacterized protein n=1 Tax=Hibiscus sabdariffa TaxID=183260 RepID=A0ABR2U5Q5_9ROSI